MKKILSLVMILCLVFSLSACGKADRVLYNVDLEDYVELGEYKGLKIDTKSDEYKKSYDEYIVSQVIEGGYHETDKKTEGTVANGDIANINYVGKKDGIAFDGGTADNYDLTIGSNSFIDGFEDGLIGKQIGSTVDLNLTFPTGYQNAELAGKAVVFTVTINYVKAAQKPEDFYKKAGFKNVKEFYKEAEKNLASQMLMEKVVDGGKIKDYPDEDYKIIFDAAMKQYEDLAQSQYGMTLEQLLTNSGQDKAEFDKQIGTQEVKPTMDIQMKVYAIFDKEDLELEKDAIEKSAKKIADDINNSEDSSSNVTAEEVIEYYGEYYLEYQIVFEKVSNFVYENAKKS